MTDAAGVGRALQEIAEALGALGREFALVGGLAVSVRAEVRFTRDVDVAVSVRDDDDAEQLVHALGAAGFRPVATVEHERLGRLSTVRMLSPSGVKTDLLFASSGIEPEIVAAATRVDVPGIGDMPVASADHLLAMKLLSMGEQRLQDRIDAGHLLESPDVRLDRVRDLLRLIASRGAHRDQDLMAKLDALLT